MSRARNRGAYLNGRALYPEDRVTFMDVVMVLIGICGLVMVVYGLKRLLS